MGEIVPHQSGVSQNVPWEKVEEEEYSISTRSENKENSYSVFINPLFLLQCNAKSYSTLFFHIISR